MYCIIQWTERLGMITGFDIGFEQKQKNSSTYNSWYTPYVQVRYKLSKKFCISGRGEYYDDKNNVIIQTASANGFQTFGYSINTDLFIHQQAVWRIEARTLQSNDKIFILQDKASRSNYLITTSIAVWF